MIAADLDWVDPSKHVVAVFGLEADEKYENKKRKERCAKCSKTHFCVVLIAFLWKKVAQYLIRNAALSWLNGSCKANTRSFSSNNP